MLKKLFGYSIHVILFLLAFVTATIAGAEHVNQPLPYLLAIDALSVFSTDFGFYEPGWKITMTWEEFKRGLYFSIPFIGILTAHEFGHYFVARWHKVKTSLPYFIPFYLPGGLFYPPIIFPQIGTMGAMIRMRSLSQTRKQYFDIGIAGPLGGYVLAIGLLIYGFTHLPEPSYLLDCDPTYEQAYLQYGADSFNKHLLDDLKEISSTRPEGEKVELFRVGTNLTFLFFESVVADPSRVPNHYDLLHYPFLFAGFFALFFTALNLIPIGQLDGGHILYGLLGDRKARHANRWIFTAFIVYAGLGNEYISLRANTDYTNWITSVILYFTFLYICCRPMFEEKLKGLSLALAIGAFHLACAYWVPELVGYQGWLLYCLLISRVMGVFHPIALGDRPLDRKRKILGYVALVIFVISFSPMPITLETI